MSHKLLSLRRLASSAVQSHSNMKIAIIGQSVFASSVYQLLQKNGHEIVGVFTIPDVNNREDPLASVARNDGVPVFKFKVWRSKGIRSIFILARSFYSDS